MPANRRWASREDIAEIYDALAERKMERATDLVNVELMDEAIEHMDRANTYREIDKLKTA